MLDVKNLCVSSGKTTLLDLCSVQIAVRECLVIQGPSGSGKSTILKAIAGLLDQSLTSQGQITLSGRTVEHLPAEERGIGMLFQRPLLFPHLSVGQNIALGMVKDSTVHTKSQRQQRVNEWLNSVQLVQMAEQMPQSLSGGQQARVALARALAANPKAMLLDEPFSALDPELRQHIHALTFQHLAKAKIPVILVTHDSSDVPTQHLTPRLYQMRDGKLGFNIA